MIKKVEGDADETYVRESTMLMMIARLDISWRYSIESWTFDK